MKGVERIVLDNPPANSLDIPHLRRILKRLKEIERRSDSRAVIISSSRTAVFSSGLAFESDALSWTVVDGLPNHTGGDSCL